jgi:hypothetical protein
MGIDNLTKAANAAGYAMANSEDFLETAPAVKKVAAPAGRPAVPVRPAMEGSIASTSAATVREWWFSLSGKATA